MITSPEARAIAKRAQLARLGLKGTSEYAELYAKQPAQIRKKVEQQVQRKAERDARNALIVTANSDAAEAADLFETAGHMSVGD